MREVPEPLRRRLGQLRRPAARHASPIPFRPTRRLHAHRPDLQLIQEDPHALRPTPMLRLWSDDVSFHRRARPELVQRLWRRSRSRIRCPPGHAGGFCRTSARSLDAAEEGCRWSAPYAPGTEGRRGAERDSHRRPRLSRSPPIGSLNPTRCEQSPADRSGNQCSLVPIARAREPLRSPPAQPPREAPKVVAKAVMAVTTISCGLGAPRRGGNGSNRRGGRSPSRPPACVRRRWSPRRSGIRGPSGPC